MTDSRPPAAPRERLHFRIKVRHKRNDDNWHWWGWTHPTPGGDFASVEMARTAFQRVFLSEDWEGEIYEITAQKVGDL